MSYLEDKLPTTTAGEKNLSRHEELLMLDSIRKRVKNYVYTLTGQFIPVEFKVRNINGEELESTSYTDGKRIVIGGSLQKESFPSTIGLALHEGSHIVLTDFDHLRQFAENMESVIDDEIFEIAEDIGMEKENAQQVLKHLYNWIEDRRIDKYIFDTSPGYKSYYHSMYDKYFRSEEVTALLKSNAYTKETWDSYLHRITNFLNPNTSLNALKGLRAIWETINVSDIGRLNTSIQSMDVAQKVFKIISEYAEDSEFHRQPTLEEMLKNASKEAADELSKKLESGEIDADDLVSEHTGQQAGGGGIEIDIDDLSDEAKQKLLDAIKKQHDFLDQEIKKEGIDQDTSQDLSSINSDNATYKHVGKGFGPYPQGIDALVIRNIGMDMIDRGLVPYASKSPVNEEAVIKGIQLGSILGRKLQIRDERRVTKFTRKKSGKIDKRILASLAYDNESIFHRTHVDEYRDAGVHISVDASGSMGGQKWVDAMVMCSAIAKACSMISNVDCAISFRTTDYNGGKPVIIVAYDSKKDPVSKIRYILPHINSGGTTPEGLCFEAIKKDMFKFQRSKDMYLINISDGQPYFHGSYDGQSFQYSGEPAAHHTASVVKSIRQAGIKVLSYFITSGGGYGGDMGTFRTMYGSSSKQVSPENITGIARTMNKKFLEK